MGVFAKFLKAKAAQRTGDQWNRVRFPDFAVDAGRELNSPDQNAGTGWVEAPATSHVKDFKWLDARRVSPNSVVASSIIKNAGGRSVLSVRFKPTRTQGTTHYEYYFADHNRGELVWKLLQAANHPGEVVHDYLIGWSIPYRRVS